MSAPDGVVDLTGSIYSLIVVSSATLAVSQYLFAQLKAPFEAARNRLKGTAEKEGSPLYNVLKSKQAVDQFETTAKNYDNLLAQVLNPLVWEIVALFGVLVASSILQGVNVTLKVWIGSGFDILAVFILLCYGMVSVALVSVGRKFFSMRGKSTQYGQEIDTLIASTETFWGIYCQGKGQSQHLNPNSVGCPTCHPSSEHRENELTVFPRPAPVG